MQIRLFGKIRGIPIIVPTANFLGPTFQSFRSRLGDQLIIGVESSGNEFNFSRSVNAGIKTAVTESNPDHMIVSNDDVSVTSAQIALLQDATENASHSCAYFVPLINGSSNPLSLISSQLLSLFALMMRARTRSGEVRRSSGNLTRAFLDPLLSLVYLNQYRRKLLKLCQSFLEDGQRQFRIHSPMPLSRELARRFDATYIGEWLGPFSLYDSDILERVGGFDERYANGFEDFDLMYRISVVHKFKHVLVDDVNVRHGSGTSLGGLSAYYYRLYKAIVDPQMRSFSFGHKTLVNGMLNEIIFQYVVNGIDMPSRTCDFITRSRRHFAARN
jgi:GT2 family glycosyltransferase